ncbi:MAG: enolase C-terminal domain-like protein [Pseudomonadota bacterium]
MQITDLKLRRLEGIFEYPGTLWEERGARPLDIYPEFRRLNAEDTAQRQYPQVGEGRYRVTQTFLTIETDAGVDGTIGPITGDATAFYLAKQIKPLLIGRNPLATEHLWDLMYRNAPNGRAGDNMIAISYADYALWDIKGKHFGVPAHVLLGGPVQDRIPAYVSTAGYSLEPKRAAERVAVLREEGFVASKWFFRRGVGDGLVGERENVELMAALRDGAGADMQIMIDAWANWGVPYTLRMAKLLTPYAPAWIEEPLQYPLYDSYAALRRESAIPIAGGEHEFTRWGVKNLLDRQALDIYQLEPVWAGGLSELAKIGALLTSSDATFIPHVYLPAASAQVAFTHNVMTTPLLEYHRILGELYQCFLTTPYRPIEGYFYPPEKPGIGLGIDENKLESERAVTFD